jgi:hypothetical protein
VGPSLRLSRVLALVGGLALLAAFFMPWFSSGGLLLSGQFLHTFLGSASPADLRRFLPTSSPSEVQLLRVLVDVFPVSGAIAASCALLGGLVVRAKLAFNVVLGLAGLIPLLAWAGGITRLPQGAGAEIGLWLIAFSSIAVLVGLLLELVYLRARRGDVRGQV